MEQVQTPQLLVNRIGMWFTQMFRKKCFLVNCLVVKARDTRTDAIHTATNV